MMKLLLAVAVSALSVAADAATHRAAKSSGDLSPQEAKVVGDIDRAIAAIPGSFQKTQACFEAERDRKSVV